MSFYEWFVDQLKNNQFMSGAIGGSLSYGLIAYFKTFVYSGVYKVKTFFSRQITVLSAKDSNYYAQFVKHVSSFVKHPKNISLEAQTSEMDELVSHGYKIGYGTNWFWYNWFTFVSVLVEIDSDNHTERKTESIQLNFISLQPRRQREKFLKEFSDVFQKSIERVTLYRSYTYGDFGRIPNTTIRSPDSVFIKPEILEKITHAIDKTYDDNTVYKEAGIPRHLGVMLYGPPGTGKTSLIQALANKYKKNIYYLNVNHLKQSNTLETGSMKEGSFVVIEDIDSYDTCHERTEEDLARSKELSVLLTILDGLGLPNKVIIFATTNRLEVLDSAITRPGRFDICEKLDYADRELAEKMIRYFDESKLHLLDELTFPISQAALQFKILKDS